MTTRDATMETVVARGGSLLELENISVHFPVGADWLGRPQAFVHAVNDVTLTVYRGETLGIVGESGCGKSTLGQVVMGLVEPTSGSVRFRGHDFTELDPASFRKLRRNFQVVFQDPQSSLDPRMRVEQLITEPLVVAGGRTPRQLRERAEELAEHVGLDKQQLQRYPHEFSGGQRQRIAVARALALDPDVVVLDEPTSALDVSVQAQILNLLLRLQRELELTYIFISHDISVIRHISDRVAVMYLGEVVELGPTNDVLEDPGHPYTQTLLAAVPTLANRLELTGALENAELPSNLTLPTGCFFRGRCPFAVDDCGKRQELLRVAGEGSQRRLVRCHRRHELPAGGFGSE